MEIKKDNESIIKDIAKYLMTNKMVKETDLLGIIPSRINLMNFIKILNYRFSLLGCEIVKTDYLDEDYYVLVIEGKDPELLGEKFGILAIIVFLSWEFENYLSTADIMEIFSEFQDEISSLKKLGYLKEHEINSIKSIIPTPIAKVLFKNLVNVIKIEDIFKSLGIETRFNESIVEPISQKVKKTQKKTNLQKKRTSTKKKNP